MLVTILTVGALCAYDLYEDYQAKYHAPELEVEETEKTIVENIIEETFVYENKLKG